RCRVLDQGADQADSAAVARRRRASAGGIRRVVGKDRARPDAGIARARGGCPPLRRPWGNAYIRRTSVIADDTKLRPRGRAEHRGDLAMSAIPLMPKATAVWLVENTALSFDQVADFCKLHPLEVKAIADGDAAQGIKGLDPIQTGQLTREEIAKAEGEPEYRLQLLNPKVRLAKAKDDLNVDAVFAKLKQLGGKSGDKNE